MCTSSFLVLVLCVYTSKPLEALVLGVLVSGCAVRDVMATKLLVIGVISNYLAPAVWSLISDHCANSFNVINSAICNSLIIHHRGLEEGDVGQRLFCHHLLPTALGPRGQEEDWIKHCRYFTLLIGAIQSLNSEVKIYYFSHLIFQTISLISAIKHFTLFRLESIFGCQGERPSPIHKVDTTVTPMWQEAKVGLGGQAEWHCTRR